MAVAVYVFFDWKPILSQTEISFLLCSRPLLQATAQAGSLRCVGEMLFGRRQDDLCVRPILRCPQRRGIGVFRHGLGDVLVG